MGEIQREIVLTDNISLLIKGEDKIDAVTANSEATILSKLFRVIDNLNDTTNVLEDVPQKTVKRSYNSENRRVSEEDANKLISDYESAVTHNEKREVARKYGYPSVKNLYSKYFYLKNRNKNNNKSVSLFKPKNFQKWSKEEEEKLIKLKTNHTTTRRIAERLGRTEEQVRSKVKYMRARGVKFY